MQRAKEMLWSDQANFYRNPLKSATSDSFAFKQSSVPIPNDVPASIIKQLSVPTKSLTTTQRNLFLLRNEDNSEIMTLCLLHPAKSAANYATSRNLLLFYIRNDPAIMIQSLFAHLHQRRSSNNDGTSC